MNISAIIPVYNGKKYLREAVNSVIQQSLQPIELIVVDDGSTDDSLREIEDIKAPFPIHTKVKKNGGQSSARNLGACEAKGEFIALLDQDDVWYSQHLEKLAKPFSEDPNLGFVYSNVDHTDAAGKVVRTEILNFCSFQHPQTQLSEMIKQDMFILPSATLINKKAFFDVGMFDERLIGYEDDDLCIRLFARGWKRRYIPESLSQWRIHGHNCGILIMHKSRKIYAKKIVEELAPLSPFKEIPCAELIGMRLFNTTVICYMDAFNSNNYSECLRLLDELIYYFKLIPSSVQKSWRLKLFFMKRPALFRMAKKLNKLRQL